MTFDNLIARAEITINATADKVWNALVDPALIKNYMFGATVISDWKMGSPIIWKGIWKGKPYEDKGKVLFIDPGKKLQYSHFSPLAGMPDLPENYHKVTMDLLAMDKVTYVTLTQDNNPSEESKDHAEQNWNMMLESLKKLLEKRT